MNATNCTSCGAAIANPAMTGIFCDTCHGATAKQGNTYLQGGAAIGAAAGAVPFFFHITVNGLNYVALGAGLVAVVFGLVGLISVVRSEEKKPAQFAIPVGVVLLGLFQLFRSGVL